MLIFGFDVETTGLNPNLDVITEVAAVWWDTDRHRAVLTEGLLVQTPGLITTPQTEEITGVTADLCSQWGVNEASAIRRVHALYTQADYACAHNVPFDRKFFIKWCEKFGLDPQLDKVWIDTERDIPYPERYRCHKLGHLAVEHGIFNPFAHQAVGDVYTMFAVLDKYDINEVIGIAKSPTIKLKAHITYQDVAYREEAKSKGFFACYYGNKFRFWWKAVKECHLENLLNTISFGVAKLTPEEELMIDNEEEEKRNTIANSA